MPGWAVPLVTSSRAAGEDPGCALDLARQYGTRLPQPGGGQTAGRWAVLAAVSEQNLTAGRVLEAHSDALAILVGQQLGSRLPERTIRIGASVLFVIFGLLLLAEGLR